MPKYLTSLSEIISFMDFLSEVSTLYRVKPGPEFELVASNSTAEHEGAGSKNLHGKLLKDFIPRDFYADVLFPLFCKVVDTRRTCRYEHSPPFPGSVDIMDIFLSPVIENEECTHIWVITKNRQSENELEHLAFHDELTRVPNRRFFLQRLNIAYTRYQQHHIKFALMMIDCDHFKRINDSWGHDVGDTLIQQTAQRIQHCIRENDFVARFGGDEFIVLLEAFKTEDSLARIAERTLHQLQEPFHIDENTLNITSSIGISIMNQGQDMESTISLADKALYAAKLKGGNTYVLLDA